MTQLENAKRGNITPLMKKIALDEDLSPEVICEKLANNRIVILHSKLNNIKPSAIGEGLRIKVNANIGSSIKNTPVNIVTAKTAQAIEYGTDTIMDLTCAGDFDNIRQAVLQKSTLPIGSCPVYQIFGEVIQEGQDICKIQEESFFEIIEKHARDGVSFMGIHCAITQEGIEKTNKRLMRIVSRGGGFLTRWMIGNKKENPLFLQFDRILKILKKYDVVLDISDCLRPGCIHDANDSAHIYEIFVVRDLVQRALSQGVSVMVEGPGHMSFDQIEYSVKATYSQNLHHLV